MCSIRPTSILRPTRSKQARAETIQEAKVYHNTILIFCQIDKLRQNGQYTYFQQFSTNYDLTSHALQASESRLYTFSQDTKDALRKFRLSTSRAKDPQAVICERAP